MRKPRLKDMEPSPAPWRWRLEPSGNAAVVKGADGSIVAVCHPANAKAMTSAVNGRDTDAEVAS